MADNDPAEVGRLADAIAPLLAGRGPSLQGAVLAELMARWLAGHFCPRDRAMTADMREELLALHVKAVRDLVPVNEAMLLERAREAGHG